MLKKEIFHGEEARRKLLIGVEKIGLYIGNTLGPQGRNAIIKRPHQPPLITNDGVTIARYTRLEDPIEDLGAQTIVETAMKTNQQAGDGTTTSVVIAVSLIRKCFSLLSNSATSLEPFDPMTLYRKIQESKEKALALLKAKAVDTVDIEDIITTSLEDREFGKVIADMMKQVGKDGHITTEDNYATQYGITTETTLGMKFYGTYATPWMMTNIGRKEAIAENTPIIVTNGELEEIASLQKVFEELKKQGNLKCVIFAEKYSTNLVKSLAEIAKGFHEGKQMQILAIKIPSLTEDECKDIASFTKAEFFDRRSGSYLKDLKIYNVGFAQKVTVNGEYVSIMGGDGDVVVRTKELKEQLEQEKDLMFKAKLEKRIASLNSGVGIIRVGTMTEIERGYRKLKIEDAVNSARAALEEGVVKGGGLALKEVAEELGKDNILYDCLCAPYNKIQENAGKDFEVDEKVVDPVKVTRLALENAISAASIFITSETAIADRPKTLWDELDNKLTMMHDNPNDFRDTENMDLGAGRIVE